MFCPTLRQGNALTRLSVVALAPDRWHGPWFNRQHLLSRLSAHHDILYSNGLWTIWDRYSKGWREAPWLSSWETADGVCLDFPSRWRLRWPTVPVWDQLMVRAQARRLRAKLPSSQPLVAHIYHPEFAVYLEPLAPDYVIYHAFDRYSLFPDWTPENDALQRHLVARADLVIGTSQNTVDELSRYRDGVVHQLPNGVTVDAFDQVFAATSRAEPSDIANIPHPRIGYVGTLNPKVDLALLRALAESHAEWNFVFVGGQKQLDDDADMAHFARLKNVHLLGPKPRQMVPHYATAMDVNIIPYRVDEGLWSIAGDPLKLYESLAARTPVVACELASLRGFSDVIEIAQGVQGWAQALQRAISGQGPGSAEDRRRVAHENSWDRRADQLRNLIDEMVASR